LEEHKYETTGSANRGDQIYWYEIKLPTAWMNMGDLVFQLGEVE
jgi:hypothetical protein